MLRLGIICCLLAATTLAKPQPKTSKLPDPTEDELGDIPVVPLKLGSVGGRKSEMKDGSFQQELENGDIPVVPLKFPGSGSGSGSGSRCGSGCQCGVSRGSRVVGGTQAAAGQFPWQAGLVFTGGTRTFCGGSVINNLYVLTAAHCTDGLAASYMQVLLGDLRIGIADAGEQRYSVQQIIKHPQYVDAIQSGWDYALLKVDRQITYSSTVSPICLAQAGQTYAGVAGIASGFGQVGDSSPQSNWLLYVPLTVWTQDACRGVVGSIIRSTVICAGGSAQGGQGICFGDSGGPLAVQVSGRYHIIGISSFMRPCAHANTPDMFARVTEALSWIQSNTADAQYCTA